MKKDTKVYSEFIKRNNIKVTGNSFTYKQHCFSIYHNRDGWFIDYVNGELYNTKKSCIYFTIKNYIYNETI